MKACPTCFRIYPQDAAFCPADGSGLGAYEQVPAQSDPEDRHLGTTMVGRYEVRRIVADGGMGRVYEARDRQQDRRVAIKLLHPEVARDAVAVERFKREFEISRELPHAHIVDVLDFQLINEMQSILVMEFLEGEELRTLLKTDSKVEPARLVRIVSQVAIGLDEAHRRQFVHRDLKPDNIFLCGAPDGDQVKILDFGSVCINKNRQMSKLTSMGTTIGSPYYMSPEQAQGAEGLDHRADVFALGAIVYEALTGQVPFYGNNGPAILLAILTKNPQPVSTKVPGLPAALDDVIDDALAKKPETRTGSIGAFADQFGKAFGIPGDHHAWARMTADQLRAQMGVAPVAPPVAVADPFAMPTADPFGSGGGGPAPVAAPPSANLARQAMDDAFAQAGEAAYVPAGKPIGLIVGLVVAGLAVVGVVLFLVLS